jgi:ATP-dependent Clp protease ATP-binding subunit ClpA
MTNFLKYAFYCTHIRNQRVFSTELSYTIEAAYQEAVSRKHEFFTVEHLLFALLYDDDIKQILEACGARISVLRLKLEEYFAAELETGGHASEKPLQTPSVERVLQRAVLQVRSGGGGEVQGRDVLVAIYGEGDSHASFFLESEEVSRLDVVNFVSHGVGKLREHNVYESSEEKEDYVKDGVDSERSGSTRKAIHRFAENLTSLASEGKLDPVIGRSLELERALKTLSRRTKNNPLFVGEPGVGKTALAHGLAHRLNEGLVPDSLKGASLFSLNLGSAIAGTRYRGDFEERLKGLLDELAAFPKAILFIDEIHTLVGAGATGGGSLDAANLLKPALSSGSLRCVGSTTHDDFKKSLEKDKALLRRFSVISVDEPSEEEALAILEGLRSHFEKHHTASYSNDALKSAVTLSSKYIKDKFLPDKAIDVIDEAGAANSYKPLDQRKAIIESDDIEAVVSVIAKVPVQSVSINDTEQLKFLGNHLKAKVFGQDTAVDAVVTAIKRSRAHLGGATRPIGCFLFAGPTGVGKTELAKSLALELGVTFHRFDMSEFMEKHAVSRLIGAPPGYVGYEEGGLLIDAVRKDPYSVVLFDEIEKAHHDVYSILLQVMEDAVLTDSKGRKADFRHTVIILTSNAGSELSGSLGFGSTDLLSVGRERAIKQTFKPEFRNRLDEIIYFRSLSPEIILSIVDKLIAELNFQLIESNIEVQVTLEAKQWLAREGMDPVLGARPMRRALEKRIKDPLADEILFGSLSKGGTAQVYLEEDDLKFAFEAKQSPFISSARHKELEEA